MNVDNITKELRQAIKTFVTKSLGFSAPSQDSGREESEAMEHICGTAAQVGPATYKKIVDLLVDRHKKYMQDVDWELILNPAAIRLYEQEVSEHHQKMDWDFVLVNDKDIDHPRIVGAPEMTRSLTALAECVAIEKLFDIFDVHPLRSQHYKELETVDEKLAIAKQQIALNLLMPITPSGVDPIIRR